MSTPLANQLPLPNEGSGTAGPGADGIPRIAPRGVSRWRRVLTMVALSIGAVAFLFPFYYMIVGSLQRTPDTSVSGAFPAPSNLTLDNYVQINSSLNLGQSLLNSGIFTGGVLLCTVLFGVLAGYALAMLQFRGKGTVFSLMMLLLVVPFQLLMIPLYVMIARDFGLGDTYVGMILPFAINSTAVFIFRQYFLQLPAELFQAARIDGAGELRTLWYIALPLVRPALLTAVLLTFIGPWNEFLWPFLITKQQAKQPLAVSLANYISTVAASAANPFGAILAGAVVLAVPAVGLFLLFQRHFVSTDLGSGVKG
jgi:ABC-type glycerol-3-phosphate transport system permease component